MTMTYDEVREALLQKYGGQKRWIRYNRTVRVVDAFPRRAGHYLGWTFAEPAPGERIAVVRISEHNFARFYRQVQAPNPEVRS